MNTKADVVFYICIILLLSILVNSYGVGGTEPRYLGEFFKGDKIKIRGRLVFVENGLEIPIPGASIELYANFSSGRRLFLGINKTDNNGVFIFSVHLDQRFPTGEIIFTAYYPGDPLVGFDSVRIYYKAVIKQRPVENLSYTVGFLIGVSLLTMLALGSVIVTVRISKHKQRAEAAFTWIEILDNMITKVMKKDFGFIMLAGTLLDSLCRRLGKIPQINITPQEKLLLIKEYLSEEGFNILKNVISLYEIQLFGGPYARSVLMASIDFGVWAQLLKALRDELASRYG